MGILIYAPLKTVPPDEAASRPVALDRCRAAAGLRYACYYQCLKSSVRTVKFLNGPVLLCEQHAQIAEGTWAKDGEPVGRLEE